MKLSVFLIASIAGLTALLGCLSISGYGVLERGMDCEESKGYVIVGGEEYFPASCPDAKHVLHLKCIGGKLNIDEELCPGTSTCYPDFGCLRAVKNWNPFRRPSGLHG